MCDESDLASMSHGTLIDPNWVHWFRSCSRMSFPSTGSANRFNSSSKTCCLSTGKGQIVFQNTMSVYPICNMYSTSSKTQCLSARLSRIQRNRLLGYSVFSGINTWLFRIQWNPLLGYPVVSGIVTWFRNMIRNPDPWVSTTDYPGSQLDHPATPVPSMDSL